MDCGADPREAWDYTPGELLELIRGHKSVTVMDEKKKKGFREAVAECNGRPAAEFFDEMSRQAKEHFDHA